MITTAVKESNRRNDFSPEYQAAFDATFNKAMADVSAICKANSQCVTEVANSLLMARLVCDNVECANDHAGGAVRNAALRYGSMLDVGKLVLGDFGWLIGLKGPSNTATKSIDAVVPNSGKTSVYVSTSVDGTTQYVGITDNLEARAAAHSSQKGIEIDPIPGLQNISREDARAVEQVLIEYNGLGKNGGTLINKINSIAVKNPIYAQSLQRGAALLKSVGYPGF